MSTRLKNYKVIVSGQREEKALLVVEPVEYHLPAESKEKAILAAKEKFGNEYPNSIEVKAKVNKQSIASIIFLMFPIFLSFIPWYFPGGSELSLKPTLIPMLFSVAIYSSVIIRIKGLKNSFNAIFEVIGNSLTIVFIASFISLLAGDANIKILSFTLPISGKPLLIFAAMLSWLGMPKIAKFVWIALFVLAAFRILAADAAMGIWGMVYVLFGFLGIVFQLKQESDIFLNTLGHEFIAGTAKARAVIRAK